MTDQTPGGPLWYVPKGAVNTPDGTPPYPGFINVVYSKESLPDKGPCNEKYTVPWKARTASAACRKDVNAAMCARTYQGCINLRHGDGDLTSVWAAENPGSNNSNSCIRVQATQPEIVRCCTGQSDDFEACGHRYCPGYYTDEKSGKRWVVNPACEQPLATYCSSPNNVSKDVCQNFCKDPQYRHYCDAAMGDFCRRSESSKDPLCACINSGTAIPSCLDNKCIGHGYQTTTMLAQASNCPCLCGVILACRAAGRCQIDDNIVEVICKDSGQCGKAFDYGALQEAAALHNGGETGVAYQPYTDKQNEVNLVLSALFVVIVIAVVGFLGYKFILKR